mmetsp:Transcript_37938/g.74277  ORF Transcript_37938/g.74277 Transcript_37938/m.74277 type:complete len:147 (-) Transcript_37938:16-456(-)
MASSLKRSTTVDSSVAPKREAREKRTREKIMRIFIECLAVYNTTATRKARDMSDNFERLDATHLNTRFCYGIFGIKQGADRTPTEPKWTGESRRNHRRNSKHDAGDLLSLFLSGFDLCAVDLIVRKELSSKSGETEPAWDPMHVKS